MSKVGVVLVSLGTPPAATAAAIRPWLARFLRDRRVVGLPRWLWLPILYGFILPFRPAKVALKYQRVWLSEGSPLAVYTTALTATLAEARPHWWVRHAMRFGEPDIARILADASRASVERLLIVPLFPQYSSTTTASVLDEVYRYAQRQLVAPAFTVIRDFYTSPIYIGALAASIVNHWNTVGSLREGGKLIISFHSIPQALADRGDLYVNHCQATAAALAERLDLAEGRYEVCFQSAFGGGRWVGPDTLARLIALARQGQQRVDVICPGFLSDCLETLWDMGIEGRDAFLAAGGKAYHYIPCLNVRDEWRRGLPQLLENYLERR